MISLPSLPSSSANLIQQVGAFFLQEVTEFGGRYVVRHVGRLLLQRLLFALPPERGWAASYAVRRCSTVTRRVDLGGGNRRVTEELLDDSHVGSPGEHVRRARVPQHVRVYVTFQPGYPGPLLDHTPDPLASEAASSRIQEDSLCVSSPRPTPRE